MKAKTIIILVLIALLVVVLVQNTQIVIFRLLLWRVSISEIILVPLVLLIGFVLGFLVAKKGPSRKPKV